MNFLVQEANELQTVSIHGIKSTMPSHKSTEGSITKTIQLTPSQINELKQAIILQQHHSGNQNNRELPGRGYYTPILDHTGTRKRQDNDKMNYSEKRRKTEKIGKGLRHFSMKVCEKVQKKGTTSYNEVADELVGEFTDPLKSGSLIDQQYDQKNIRRRVYDALNVLMAMNIISKEKKEIRWLGLPTNSLQECLTLEDDKILKIKKIRSKTEHLHRILVQYIAIKNLLSRNRNNETIHGSPKLNSTVHLPFIIINTDKKTVVNCSISNDKTEYLLNFNDKFEIHDDIEILKEMGLTLGIDKGRCSDVNIQRLRDIVPKILENYIEQVAMGDIDQCVPALLHRQNLNVSYKKASNQISTSSHPSLNEEVFSPSQYFSDDEEEEDEDETDMEDQVDSDFDIH